MSDTTTTITDATAVRRPRRGLRGQPDDPRRRENRPERISLGEDELVREDLLAEEYRQTKQTMARHDKKGAPFVKIAGVRYRPRRGFQEYLASQIQHPNVKPTPRRASR